MTREELEEAARAYVREHNLASPWIDTLADFAAPLLARARENTLSEIRASFRPVLSWYDGGGEIAEPSLATMIAAATEDLRRDREELLKVPGRIARERLEAANMAQARALDAERNRMMCREEGDLDGAEYWNGMAKGLRALEDALRAKASPEVSEQLRALAREFDPTQDGHVRQEISGKERPDAE